MNNILEYIKNLFGKKNIEKVKEFVLTNKRYFAAGLLLICFVLVLVFGMNNGGVTSANGGNEELSQYFKGQLKKNGNKEIAALIESYYQAYADGNVETLANIAKPLTDNEKSYVGAFSSYFEKYENVTTYVLESTQEGSYYVSVVYDLKFYEIETLAPGMDFFYVQTAEDGTLYINNAYCVYNLNRAEIQTDAEVYNIITTKYEYLSDVVDLQQDVEKKFNDAILADNALLDMVQTTIPSVMKDWLEGVLAQSDTEDTEGTEGTEVGETTESEEPEVPSESEEPEAPSESEEPEAPSESEEPETPSESESESETPKNTKYKTTCNMNIREKASTESAIIGKLLQGAEIESVGTEGDWTKIKFGDKVGYVLTKYLEKVQ